MSNYAVKLVNPPADLVFWYAAMQTQDGVIHNPDDKNWRSPLENICSFSGISSPVVVWIFFSQPSVNNGAGYNRGGSGQLILLDNAVVTFDASTNRFTTDGVVPPPPTGGTNNTAMLVAGGLVLGAVLVMLLKK